MESKQAKLMWHWLAIVYVWHVGGDVDDETAYVALTRLRKFVDEAIAVLEGPTPSELDEEK